MKPWTRRFASDYGMVFVLLLLCGFFSVATISEQFPVGEEAAVQVAGQVRALGMAKGATVLVAAGDQPSDAPFATWLEKELGGEFRVVGIAKGEPRSARELLAGLAASRRALDVVACTQSAAGWLVFSDMASDFPGLGTPRLIVPRSHRWPNFLKPANLLNIANQIAVIAILAIGMTVVIITGGIDLSVGSLLALSAVLSARFIRDLAGGVQATPTGMVLSCLGAIVLCGAAGLFSGAMITRFRIPPFIVTLAMMLVGSGLAYTLAEGQSVYQVPDAFTWLGRGADLFGLPNAVVLMLVLYAAAHVLMSRMRLGRYFYGVGGNAEAARLSGVPVRRVLMFAYLGSALLAGLGGVIMASQLRSGSATYGNMYELYVIAAVVVGGTSLSGGEGKMPGTLVGAFTIAVIQNGMNLANVESYTQRIVLGLVILGAVLLDKLRHGR